MGNVGKSITDLFTDPSAWKGKNSFLKRAFDPAGFFVKFEETTPREKTPPNMDSIEAEAAAREKERRRLSGSATSSRRSADTLSASIGKRVLGGSS